MPGLFALFKGDSGAGKSVGALSFPHPVVLDFDRKMPAIANKHFPGKQVAFKQYESVLEAGETVERWTTEGCPFDTVIVDSITSLSYLCLSTMDDLKGSSILKMFQTMKDTRGGAKMPELRGFDYYNAEDSFLKWYIDKLKILWARTERPHHVIIIAHVMTSESQDIRTKTITKTRRIVTAGQKIAAYIPAQFDETYHFFTKHGDILAETNKVRHVATTEAIGDDFAKTAYKLPTQIDFTNGSLYEKLEQAIASTYHSKLPETQTEETKAAKRIIFNS